MWLRICSNLSFSAFDDRNISDAIKKSFSFLHFFIVFRSFNSRVSMIMNCIRFIHVGVQGEGAVIVTNTKAPFTCFFFSNLSYESNKNVNLPFFSTVMWSTTKETGVSTIESGRDSDRFGYYESNKSRKMPRDQNKDATIRKICLFDSDL